MYGDLGDKVFYIVTDNVFDKINQNNDKDILGKIKEYIGFLTLGKFLEEKFLGKLLEKHLSNELSSYDIKVHKRNGYKRNRKAHFPDNE